MNSRPNFLFIAFIGIATLAFLAAGSIRFVYLKNSQLQVIREIEEVEDTIAEAELDIKMEKINKNRILNRFELAARLKKQESNLEPISFANLETLPLETPEIEHRRAVVVTSP